MTATDILLTTINAKYPHCAFGLRYLLANLGALRERAALVELTDRERPADAAERLLARDPRIVGIGVYIWNAAAARDLTAILKRVRPELCVVLGGPEVSHEIEDQPIVELADHVIQGEGEQAFASLCERVLAGDRSDPKIIGPSPPDLDTLTFPYDLYDAEDIAQRVLYVEASRGCPYRCAFCLSALDRQVRAFDEGRFFAAMEGLLARGALRLKLVDRTFNLDPARCERLLRFFLAHFRPGLFLHLEVVPDNFPAPLLATLAEFPAGALQLEVGIQTLDPEVAARIGRRVDPETISENLTHLRHDTRAHLHTDLIVGLPGESLEGFAAGFDRLVGLEPHEIQVGILKRLRGAPINALVDEHRLVFADTPPYELLASAQLPFATLQQLKRFALLWDRVANSGNFQETAPLLWQESSPFAAFAAFCDWLFGQEGRVHSLALDRLAARLLDYLVRESGLPEGEIRATLLRDYTRSGRTKIPKALRDDGAPRRRRSPRPLERQKRRR